jgi:LSD1 subclass zinc finger protein
VKLSTLASGSHSIICAICETSGLRPSGHDGVLCLVCGYGPSRDVLGTLRQIIILADALGSHACEECEHPEMRLLLDRVSHCPECGSEVLPTSSNCRTQAVVTSRGHRQLRDGRNPDAPPAPKKSSQRNAMQVLEGGKT